MKTIVILGAADGALSTYRIAAEMGYRTIAVDRSTTAPGIAVADEYLQISTRDVDAILDALAGRTDIAGVLAPCSDIAVPTLRALSAAFGLPVQLSEVAAQASRDKWVVRGILDDLGVSSYGWVMDTDPVEVTDRARMLRFPVVVKPADGQGGRGVTRCTTPDEVLAAAKEASRRSYGGGVMVEEEVPGLHCNCECVVDGGRVVFMATTRQTISPPPAALTLSRDMPAGLTPDIEDTVRSIVDKVCARLEYQRGPLNLDLVVTPDGEPFVIELGLRTGGNGTDDMVRLCYGVDPIRAALQAAVGAPIDLAPRRSEPVRWRLITTDREGTLASVTGEDDVRAIPEVAEMVVLSRPGEAVRPYQDVTDRLGWYVLHAATPEALDTAEEVVGKTLRFDVSGPGSGDAHG